MPDTSNLTAGVSFELGDYETPKEVLDVVVRAGKYILEFRKVARIIFEFENPDEVVPPKKRGGTP